MHVVGGKPTLPRPPESRPASACSSPCASSLSVTTAQVCLPSGPISCLCSREMTRSRSRLTGSAVICVDQFAARRHAAKERLGSPRCSCSSLRSRSRSANWSSRWIVQRAARPAHDDEFFAAEMLVGTSDSRASRRSGPGSQSRTSLALLRIAWRTPSPSAATGTPPISRTPHAQRGDDVTLQRSLSDRRPCPICRSSSRPCKQCRSRLL